MATGLLTIGSYEAYPLTQPGKLIVGTYEPYPLTQHGRIMVGYYGLYPPTIHGKLIIGSRIVETDTMTGDARLIGIRLKYKFV